MLSQGSDDDYIGEGLAEAIMTALSRIDSLKVLSRTTSFSPAFAEEATRQELGLSKKLKVSYLLEGAVQVIESQVRVNIQLSNTTDGFQVWNEQIDGSTSALFDLQDKIAARTVEQLKTQTSDYFTLNLNSEEYHPKAYQALLKANFFFNKYLPADIRKGIELYERAIQIDPNLTEAYSGLAHALFTEASFGRMPAEPTFQRAQALVKKALSIQPESVDALVMQGMLSMYWDLNWGKAGQAFEQAIALKRDFAFVYQQYAWYLAGMRQFELAKTYLLKALEYDPLSLILINSVGDLCKYLHQYEEAIQYYERVLELDPNFRTSIEALGLVHLYAGRPNQGIQYLKKYRSKLKNPLAGITSLGFAYGFTGNVEAAKETIKKLYQRKQEEPNINIHGDLCCLYIALKQYDQALDHLEHAIQARIGIVFILADPMMDPLRRMPRFQKLIQRISFGPSVISELPTNQLDIQSEGLEKLNIPKQDFLYAEAMENYTRIVWQQNEVLREQILRLSLKKLSQQICCESLIRCHRSYIINTDLAYRISGNTKGYKIHCLTFDYSIPISRSLASDLIPRLKLKD